VKRNGPVPVGQCEEELVRAAQQGNREAFGRLYEGNVERIYRYLLARLSEAADAEDVTAEVFMRAMKALPSYEARGVPFIAWLFRIAHNEAINYSKRGQRRRETPLPELLPDLDDPAEEAVMRVSFDEVSRAMERLTDLQRQVISLRFASQLSIAETAKVMQRSEEAVKFLQFSALRALRRVLEKGEVTSHGR